MLEAHLQSCIENYSERAKATNPFFIKVNTGELSPRHLADFLASAYYLVQHTPLHLHKALKKSKVNEHDLLSAFFEEKILEEQGHDLWAKEDLQRLSEAYELEATSEVVPAVYDLIEHIEQSIDRDPALYLSYILLAEYFTVLMGPYWLERLESRCGISASYVSIISKHIELDIKHVNANLREIGSLMTSTSVRESLEMLNCSITFFDKIYQQIGKKEH